MPKLVPYRRPQGLRRRPARPKQRHPRPQGFSTAPLRPLWHLALPGIQGRDRRQLFNTMSALGAVGAGLLAGCMGLVLLGPIAGVIGLVVGLQLAGRYVVEERYFRP